MAPLQRQPDRANVYPCQIEVIGGGSLRSRRGLDGAGFATAAEMMMQPNAPQGTLVRFHPQVSAPRRLNIQGGWIRDLAAGPRGAGSPMVRRTAEGAIGRAVRAHQMAERGAINQFRSTALNAIANVPPNKQMEDLAAIQRWVQNNCRYTLDTFNLERFSSPEATLSTPPYPAGDCDDMAALAAGMAASVGYPAAVIATGIGDFQHVIAGVRPMFGAIAAQLEASGEWIPMELTPVAVNGRMTTNPPLGWFNPAWTHFKVWEVGTNGYQ